MSERWIPLSKSSLDADPFVAFESWWRDAHDEVREPEAICIATADAHGQPRARMVLLRARDERGFCFFTNYESRKGEDLEENPRAAMLWYVEPLGRQVRIEGRVEKLSAEESDAYYEGRPLGHRLGAHASDQSRVIGSRAELEEKVAGIEARFENTEPPRPAHWGGYRLIAEQFEFWQHRSDRLHDRVFYLPDGSGGWRKERRQP